MIILGLLSMGIAAASMYFQKDMKRMLAYSSVEHMGIVSLAVGFGGFIGLFAALLHIVNHAIAKPLMFFASGAVSQRYETKVMAEIKGVIKTMPVTGAILLVGGLAIAGMPPFNIFLSEFLVMTSGFGSGQFLAVSVMILAPRGDIRGVLAAPRADGLRKPEGARQGRAGGRARQGSTAQGCWRSSQWGSSWSLVVVLGFYVPQPLQTLIRDAVQVVRTGGACDMTAGSGGRALGGSESGVDPPQRFGEQAGLRPTR